MLKISKWPSLKPLAIKNVILCWSEFIETLLRRLFCVENIAEEPADLACVRLFLTEKLFMLSWDAS